MIDFQWEVVLQLCQGHFIVQQKWIISVFRFCCSLLRVNQEKMMKYNRVSSQQFGFWWGCTAALSVLCDPLCCWGGTTPQLPQLCAALGTGSLHCWAQHLHPQQQILPFQSDLKNQLCQASFYLYACLPLPLSYSIVHSVVFFCVFLTNSQEHNASSLQSHSGWYWVLDERLNPRQWQLPQHQLDSTSSNCFRDIAGVGAFHTPL